MKKILSQIRAYCESDIFRVLYHFILTEAFAGGYLYFTFTEMDAKAQRV